MGTFWVVALTHNLDFCAKNAKKVFWGLLRVWFRGGWRSSWLVWGA